MAKSDFQVGNEVMVRGAVTAVWPDGLVTVQIAGAGHKVTLGGDSGYIVIVVADGERAPKPSGKRGPVGLGQGRAMCRLTARRMAWKQKTFEVQTTEGKVAGQRHHPERIGHTPR